MARPILTGSLGRNGLRLLTYLFGLPVLYLIASLAGALVGNNADWNSASGDVRIGFLRGAIHYDVLLPLDADLRRDYAFAEQGRGLPLNHPAAEWLMIGWGSAAFYTQTAALSDIALSTALKAATGDDAVIRLDITTALPDDFPALQWIWISQSQFQSLKAAVAESFVRDQTLTPLPYPAPGLSTSDSFWRAKGHFNLITPCNQWLAKVMQSAGIPFGRWTPTTQSFELALWWHGRGR